MAHFVGRKEKNEKKQQQISLSIKQQKDDLKQKLSQEENFKKQIPIILETLEKKLPKYYKLKLYKLSRYSIVKY